MPDRDELDRRLRSVERTLSGDDHDLESLRETGELADRIETLESTLAEAESRIAELEAATQALRGYVGNVRSVNEDVERRADAALIAVDRLEQQFEGEVSRDGAPGERTQPSRRGKNSDGCSSGANRRIGARERRNGREPAAPERSTGPAERSVTDDDADDTDGILARLKATL